MIVYQLKAATGEKITLDEKYYNRYSHIKFSIFNGYAMFYNREKKKQVFLHKILMPDAIVVDHINGIKLDNRLLNLRAATSQKNNFNKAKKKNSLSNFKGVFFHKTKSLKKPYSAALKKGPNLYRHYFETEIEAAKKYDELAKEHFGEFARLNFPVDTS